MFGGVAKKVMNGKCQLMRGRKEMDARIVATIGYGRGLMISHHKTQSWPSSGIQRKIFRKRQKAFLSHLHITHGGYVKRGMNGKIVFARGREEEDVRFVQTKKSK